MAWWLVKECFSAMIRPLWLTSPFGGCVAVKFSTFSAMIRPIWLTSPSGGCLAMKFSTIVSYLLIFTNHHSFIYGVVVSERVFFCNDKTIMACCYIWWVLSCDILHHCELFVNIH